MQARIMITQDGRTFEGTIELTEVAHHGKAPRNDALPVADGLPTKPAGAVDSLFGRGYFATERTLSEVRGQLQQDGYNFGASSVLMTLQSRDYLQRRGTRGAYRFVQKHPPTSRG